MHRVNSFFDRPLIGRCLEADRVFAQQIQNQVSPRSAPSAGSGEASAHRFAPEIPSQLCVKSGDTLQSSLSLDKPLDICQLNN